MNQPKVGIVMGSDSDLPVMEEAAKVLEELGISYEMTIRSAHRSPKGTSEYALHARQKGLQVIIAGAGGAAHLAGTIASQTILPVIGVPLASTSLGGFDSLLSTVQMPGGIPVATMAIGKAGARNAALFAAQILALREKAIQKKLDSHRNKLAASIGKKSRTLGKSSGLNARDTED